MKMNESPATILSTANSDEQREEYSRAELLLQIKTSLDSEFNVQRPIPIQ